MVSLWVESSARIFGKFEGVEEMRRFYPVDPVKYLIKSVMVSKVIVTRMAF